MIPVYYGSLYTVRMTPVYLWVALDSTHALCLFINFTLDCTWFICDAHWTFLIVYFTICL